MENKKKEKYIKRIDLFGEVVVYLLLFSMFVNSKWTMKIGYALQLFSVLKLILDWKNISFKKYKGREIYISFFIVLLLGILFNLISSQSNGVSEFLGRNLKFLIGMMILLFINNKEKLQKLFFVILAGGIFLSYGITFSSPLLRLDISHARAMLVMATSFLLGYWFETIRDGFQNGWKGNKKQIGLYFFVILFLLKGIADSGSRMAFLCILGVIALYGMYTLVTSCFSWKIMLTLLLLGILGAGTFYTISGSKYQQRLSTSFDTKHDMSNVYRIVMWKGSWNAFLSSPIVGVGSSTEDTGPYIQKAAEEYKENSQIVRNFIEEKNFMEAHSIYFNFLSQTGLLILVYFFVFFYQIPKRFLSHARSKIALASILGIMSFLIYGLTWSVWGFYGLIQKFFQVLVVLLILSGEFGEEKD